nr:MAG TPA: hypothetical protein [Caudoviricetes sp.]DAQ03597.1 MAG TPA: hypothetical protein [Caudoviricetes sp.]
MNMDYLNSALSVMQEKIKENYQEINAHIDKAIASESIAKKKEVFEWEDYILKGFDKIKTCLELTEVLEKERETP